MSEMVRKNSQKNKQLSTSLIKKLKIKISSKKNNLVLLLPAIVLLIISAFLYKNKVFSLSFVDEQSNMVMGYFLLQGEKIYGDIFQHHQPLTYIISVFLQKVTEPQNIYMLIQRHREFIILWSSIWSLVLIYRFGFVVFPFILIYELTKIYLFGNLFLRESLSVYPLLFIILTLYSIKEKKEVNMLLLGMIFAFPILVMAPIWPLCFGLVVLFMVKYKMRIREILLMILGALPFILLSLYFSSFKDYLFNIFYINFAYYIPGSNESLVLSAMKGFLTPFISFSPLLPSTSMLWVIRGLSFALLAYSCLIIVKYKNWNLIVLTFFILGLANFRYVQPGLEIYSGFHSLPWFAILIMMVSLLFMYLWSKSSSLEWKIVYCLLLGLGLISYFGFSSQLLFDKHDLEQDKFINYSRLYDYGEAIRIMKKEGDTLFVIPDQRLLYWQGKIDHASKTIVYYPWMDSVPPIKNEIDNMYKTSPPTFLYCKGCNSLEYPDYVALQKHEVRSNLFIHKQKLVTLTPNQLNDILFFGFYFQDKQKLK